MPQQMKPGAFRINQPLFFHFADFGGHGTALHRKIIRQALPVMRDHKFPRPLLPSLIHQIRHQLFPGGFLGHHLDFPAQGQIFPGQDLQ